MTKETFYITTAIDYPNGSPHIGHVYEKIVADVYARWNRFLGRDVWFLTGTDENGQKLVKAASDAGMDTSTFIDKNAAAFKTLCSDLRTSNDDFIRTTEKRHHEICAELWKKLAAAGDIYFDRYSGWYCLGCEAFYLESQVTDLKCPNHGTPLEHTEEDGYFLRMSKYQDWIIKFIQANESFIFPSSARKEILSRLQGDELRDLSVSRPNTGWGIPVPGDDKHVMYTWFDALINYYAGVMHHEHPERAKYWPADMHVIGKDITWFHTVIWPIMLHAGGYPLPKQVHVHGMLLAADGRKMSKSLNNVVDPYSVIGIYNNDLLRYYLLRGIASGQDGSFSINDMIDRNNNELANDFGNLALRVIKLTAKRQGSHITRNSCAQDFDAIPVGAEMVKLMGACEHTRALDTLWAFINEVNAYLNTHEPWRIKDDDAKFAYHMYNGLYAVYAIATLMQAFLPETAAKTLKMLGLEARGLDGLKFGWQEFQLGETEALFPKLEKPTEASSS